MKKNFDVCRTANILKWWLNYISAIGRNYVLNEGTIKYPFAEYLESLAVDRIQFEAPHPKLSRRRLDLCFRDLNDDFQNIFEFKYIKDGSTKCSEEKQRIFNDLMRLNLLLDTNKRGFFLIFGEQMDFIPGFQRIKKQGKIIQTRQRHVASSTKSNTAEGFYAEWFSFDDTSPKKKIDLENTKSEYKVIYDKFTKEYSSNYEEKNSKKLILPKVITTKLWYLSDNISDKGAKFQPSKIGIWEVGK